jgi:hypothetical protein
LGSKLLLAETINRRHTIWGSLLIATKGRELLQVIRDRNYTFLSTGSPTYWPTDVHKHQVFWIAL